MDGWVDRWTDKRIDVWMVGWLCGWMDSWVHVDREPAAAVVHGHFRKQMIMGNRQFRYPAGLV